MGARLFAAAVAAAVALALAGCVRDDPRYDPPPGVVVIDEPWLLQFEFDNDDAGYLQSEYLIVTPRTGESRLRTIDHPMDGLKHAGTLYDAAGEWALARHTYAGDGEVAPVTVYSLTGGKDRELDLTALTPRPETWAFVPDRPGVLRILDEGNTAVEYSVDTEKSRLVEVETGASDTPDVGEHTPHGITTIDPGDAPAGACSHVFTDLTDTPWDVCTEGGGIQIRRHDGTRWKVIGTAKGELPKGELLTVLPAVG